MLILIVAQVYRASTLILGHPFFAELAISLRIQLGQTIVIML